MRGVPWTKAVSDRLGRAKYGNRLCGQVLRLNSGKYSEIHVSLYAITRVPRRTARKGRSVVHSGLSATLDQGPSRVVNRPSPERSPSTGTRRIRSFPHPGLATNFD